MKDGVFKQSQFLILLKIKEITLENSSRLQDKMKMDSREWFFANLGYCSVVGPCENCNEISVQYVAQEFRD